MRWFFLALLSAYFISGPAVALGTTWQENYAHSLCIGLRHAYGAPTNGWKITFKKCKPANYDKVARVELYWVWFKVVHADRVSLRVAKVDPTGTLVEGPYQLSPSEYDHTWLPGASRALSA